MEAAEGFEEAMSRCGGRGKALREDVLKVQFEDVRGERDGEREREESREANRDADGEERGTI